MKFILKIVDILTIVEAFSEKIIFKKKLYVNNVNNNFDF